MNNIEYAISLMLKTSPTSERYNHHNNDDPISPVFSELVLYINEQHYQKKEDKNADINKVLHHPRFSTTCKVELFHKFFTCSENQHNLQLFSDLLKQNYFDLSTIFFSSDYHYFCLFDNLAMTKILITHLFEQQLYFPHILSYFDGFTESKSKNFIKKEFEIKDEELLSIIFDYLKICTRYSVLSQFFINGVKRIDFSYNDLNKAFLKAQEYHNYYLKQKNQKDLVIKINDILEELLDCSTENLKHSVKLLALSLGFCQIGAVGDEVELIDNSKLISFTNGCIYSPTIFNSPYINLIDCIKYYENIKQIKFAEAEIKLIISVSKGLNELLTNIQH